MKDILDQFRLGRHEFENGRFDAIDSIHPFELFELWMTEAVETKEKEPNAFVLSTVNNEGQPSSRIVYLKDIINGQLLFYTNYSSKKGEEIKHNEKVSMLFFWPEGSRQIRVEGRCSKVAEDISDAYFESRPRGSKLGAWASEQSDELKSREQLEERVEAFDEKFKEEVPRPPHWGGYQILPEYFEFWQGRPSRLHDRIVFEGGGESWKAKRLNP